jgi:hypothetical protein
VALVPFVLIESHVSLANPLRSQRTLSVVVSPIAFFFLSPLL